MSKKIVRCINAKPIKGYFIFGIKEGYCYTVENEYTCKCGRECYLLSGVYVPKHIPKVCLCGEVSPWESFGKRRFEIVEHGIISNTSIIHETVEEKIDIPVKISDTAFN